MARATYGSIITNLKGSIGGTTFQKNASGKIVRCRPRITRKHSPKQNNRNILTAIVVSLWHSLTTTQQARWAAFAAAHTKDNYYGETKTITGFNWFTSINSYRNLCGKAHLDEPPAYTTPAAVPSFTFRVTGKGLFIDFDAAFTAAESNLFIFSSPIIPDYSTKTRRKYYYTYFTDSAAVQSIDFTTEWETAHGMQFPAYNGTFNFHINIMVFRVNDTSGLVTVGTFANDMLNSYEQGIGQMIIQNNFIVS